MLQTAHFDHGRLVIFCIIDGRTFIGALDSKVLYCVFDYGYVNSVHLSSDIYTNFAYTEEEYSTSNILVMGLSRQFQDNVFGVICLVTKYIKLPISHLILIEN
jgi:hypothetical protein